jgi:viroplasmin and RNaseH domain-containing protein
MWIINIVSLLESKNNRIELVKVKSHSNDKWNDRADIFAKKRATCERTIRTEKIKCNKIEYYLEWKNRKVDIPTKLLCKIVTNARIEASWRETNPIWTLELETENTQYNWSSFWKKMNSVNLQKRP